MDEENKEKPSTDNTGEGVQPETSKLVDDTNLAAKRLEDANKEAREIERLKEENYSKMKLGGITEAGNQPEPPKKLNDTEYAEALQRGEVNPLKEDGIFK